MKTIAALQAAFFAAQTVEDIQQMGEIFTQMAEKAKDAETRASTDALTGLYNRSVLEKEIFHALAVHAREGRKFALLFIDLNDFKPLNDTYGHACGDAALIYMASQIRSSDIGFRFGGDEFAIIAEVKDSSDCACIAEHLNETLSSFCWEGKNIPFSTSVGGVMIEEGQKPNLIIQNADRAMYVAKKGKKR